MAAVSLGVAGCGGGDAVAEDPARASSAVKGEQATTDQRWPTKQELRWLDGFLRWETAFHRDLQESLRTLEAGGDVAPAVDAVTGCYSSLAADTDDPPTKRLRRLRADASASCRAFERAFHLVRTKTRPTKEDQVRFEDELTQGYKAVAAYHGRLPLGAARDLPEREGADGPSHLEPRFGRAASEIAEKTVEVRCWAKADWAELMRQQKLGGGRPQHVDGFVASVGGARIHLSPSLCAMLAGAVYGSSQTEEQEAKAGYALLGLAHEAHHTAGVADEAKATCYALQTADELTHALELDRKRIDRLVDVFWREYNALPPEYRSRECRRGGKLDLHPEDPQFP